MTPTQRKVLMFYSEMELPEDFDLDFNDIPKARTYLESRKMVEPYRTFPYFVTTRKGIEELAKGK